jgi:hypothetical protein
LPRQAPDRHRKFAAFRNTSPLQHVKVTRNMAIDAIPVCTHTHTHTHTHTSRFTRNSPDDRPFTLVHARSRSFTLVHALSGASTRNLQVEMQRDPRPYYAAPHRRRSALFLSWKQMDTSESFLYQKLAAVCPDTLRTARCVGGGTPLFLLACLLAWSNRGPRVLLHDLPCTDMSDDHRGYETRLLRIA